MGVLKLVLTMEICLTFQDPDFNDPMPEAGAAPAGGSNDSGVDEGVVMSLVESLGCFTPDHVRAALKETSGAADRAADWLFSHMVHSLMLLCLTFGSCLDIF